MKTFLAPNGTLISIPESRIIVYGLSLQEIQTVENFLFSPEYEIFVPDVVTDIFSINFDTLIIKPASIEQKNLGLIIDYYTELKGSFDESVFWIGPPKPPSHLRKKFFYYEYFSDLSLVLPEKMNKAHRKAKKSKAFSKNLADCLMILSLIRMTPGIKTRELSEKLELPVRTVQRHIASLQAAGEWIEYDTEKRGWKLQHGISILFGDHLEPNILMAQSEE